jgi:hypothetical protein
MDFMPVLLQVMPEVKGPRGVPEAFPADNKKKFHGDPVSMVCSLLSGFWRRAAFRRSPGSARGILRVIAG